MITGMTYIEAHSGDKNKTWFVSTTPFFCGECSSHKVVRHDEYEEIHYPYGTVYVSKNKSDHDSEYRICKINESNDKHPIFIR